MEIGEKVRQLRTTRNLNIKQLADLVECTPSLISQLERGKTDPSISMLKRIAKALDANIIDFFMEKVAHDDVVTRSEDRVAIQLRRWDAKIESLVKNVTNKKMQPFYTVIKPGGGSHGLYSHDGEEFGFILSGELELILDERVHKVRTNESFYFSSQIPHDWGNTGKEDVAVLWVIAPPTF